MFEAMENTSIIRTAATREAGEDMSVKIRFMPDRLDSSYPARMNITVGEGLYSFTEAHKATDAKEFTDEYILRAIASQCERLVRVAGVVNASKS
jgi:hypothetical protein